MSNLPLPSPQDQAWEDVSAYQESHRKKYMSNLALHNLAVEQAELYKQWYLEQTGEELTERQQIQYRLGWQEAYRRTEHIKKSDLDYDEG